MSASNSQGIQTLLEAESKALELVQEARAYRSQRIKDSKTEAAKEIAAYKQKKEQEFKESTAKFQSDEGKAETDAGAAAKSEVDALKSSAAQGKPKVVQYLVEQATTV